MTNGIELLNYLGIAVGVLSILATTYFALRYAEKKDPRFYNSTESKIDAGRGVGKEIKVYFKEQRVPRVSSTTLWFWNAGKRPIRKDDIPESQPLQVRLTDSPRPVNILKTEILRTSRPAIGFAAEKSDDDTISLNFDFLDHHDGAEIQVVHTGSRWAKAQVSGIVLGAPKGIRSPKPLIFAGIYEEMRSSAEVLGREGLTKLKILASFILSFAAALLITSVTLFKIELSRGPLFAFASQHLPPDDLTELDSFLGASGASTFQAGMYITCLILCAAIAFSLYLIWRPLHLPFSLLEKKQSTLPITTKDKEETAGSTNYSSPKAQTGEPSKDGASGTI